jgi:electron transfer flavoprotein beta subunit
VKILVPFKRVADTTGGETKWIVNPFDEIAIEEALRMRERGDAAEVVAVTISGAAAEEQIRSALAMGVDRAIRVHDERALDSYAVARILKGVVVAEAPTIVLMGKQAVDDDSNQAGQMLAGLLNWPQATFVSKVELVANGQTLRCTRETDAGLEVIEVSLPSVVTVDLRLNEPRYVSLPGLMKARKKPIETFDLEKFGDRAEPRSTVVATVAGEKRAAGVRLGSVEELIGKLRNQEKLI